MWLLLEELERSDVLEPGQIAAMRRSLRKLERELVLGRRRRINNAVNELAKTFLRNLPSERD